MPAHDIVIKGLWTNPESSVKIVFSRKDLNEEKVEEFIKSYTRDAFTISRFDVDEGSGEVTVIIQFEDTATAKNFVEDIKSSSRTKDNIKSVDINPGFAESFSSKSSVGLPLSLFLFH